MIKKARQIRLFIPHAPLQQGDRIILEAQAAHYLRNVMRLTVGEELHLFNDVIGQWRVRALHVAKQTVEVEALAQERLPEVLPERHLCFCPLKPAPLHFLIEKATELGVTHFHPLLSERTVVRSVKDDKSKRIAIEAAEQCERLTVPEFSPLMTLEALLKTLDPGKVQVLYGDERRTGRSLTQAAHSSAIPYLFIGPEGGFTDQEIQLLSHFDNSAAIKLSDHILRAETAAIVALAQYALAKDSLA
jgi:RNA methyltransferase, RsmE family